MNLKGYYSDRLLVTCGGHKPILTFPAVYHQHTVGIIKGAGTRRYWLYRPERKDGLERNGRQVSASCYRLKRRKSGDDIINSNFIHTLSYLVSRIRLSRQMHENQLVQHPWALDYQIPRNTIHFAHCVRSMDATRRLEKNKEVCLFLPFSSFSSDSIQRWHTFSPSNSKICKLS